MRILDKFKKVAVTAAIGAFVLSATGCAGSRGYFNPHKAAKEKGKCGLFDKKGRYKG